MPDAVKKSGAPESALTFGEDLLAEFERDAGRGLENIRKEDSALPFLGILQDLSPEVKDPDKRVQGAAAGMWINSITKELWDGREGVLVIPVEFQPAYNVWRKRTLGGGFLGSHPSAAAAAARIEEEVEKTKGTPNAVQAAQFDIVDTNIHFVLAYSSDGHWRPLVLSCKSTMLKPSRQWNYTMQSQVVTRGDKQFTPPSYAFVYKLTTFLQRKNDNSWYNFKVERVSIVDRHTLESVRQFIDAIKGGRVRVEHEQDPAGTHVGADGEGEEDEGQPQF